MWRFLQSKSLSKMSRTRLCEDSKLKPGFYSNVSQTNTMVSCPIAPMTVIFVVRFDRWPWCWSLDDDVFNSSWGIWLATVINHRAGLILPPQPIYLWSTVSDAIEIEVRSLAFVLNQINWSETFWQIWIWIWIWMCIKLRWDVGMKREPSDTTILDRWMKCTL
jgi:hypothetical protein